MAGSSPRLMKLALFVSNAGAHPAGWRAPAGGPVDLCDIDAYVELARVAERGKFHIYFSGDAQGYQQVEGKAAFSSTDFAGRLEPMTLLAALAMVTHNIGLVATASTSYNEPYALARRFASLDHISRGRAGWNVVTSTTQNEAHNFGREAHLDHDVRYRRAESFVDMVKTLWDCWEDGAVIRDAAGGRYFDPAKVHGLAGQNADFRVAGPLNVCRPPQGHPLIIQAGGSEPGRRLAARTADVVFTAQTSQSRAKDFYRDMKQRVANLGRDPAHLSILVNMQLLVRSTETEARAAELALAELVSPELAISRLQMLLGGVDLSAYPPDGPLPAIPASNDSQSVQHQVLSLAADEGLSIRQLALRAAIGRSSLTFAGTPEQVADLCEQWFRSQAADGVSLAPDYWPDGVADFVDQVVPILQRRGLFRTDYEAGTLRENFGLPRPENTFVRAPDLGVEPEIWAPAGQRP